MNLASDSDIDTAILTIVQERWSKVAFVVGRSHGVLNATLPEGETGFNRIAERIEALVEARQLLAQGDIKQWRYSEVRKPEAK